jgi:hypothetical protein
MAMTEAEIAAIIQIVCEFIDHWGRRPTPAEVLTLLKAS